MTLRFYDVELSFPSYVYESHKIDIKCLKIIWLFRKFSPKPDEPHRKISARQPFDGIPSTLPLVSSMSTEEELQAMFPMLLLFFSLHKRIPDLSHWLCLRSFPDLFVVNNLRRKQWRKEEFQRKTFSRNLFHSFPFSSSQGCWKKVYTRKKTLRYSTKWTLLLDRKSLGKSFHFFTFFFEK